MKKLQLATVEINGFPTAVSFGGKAELKVSHLKVSSFQTWDSVVGVAVTGWFQKVDVANYQFESFFLQGSGQCKFL